MIAWILIMAFAVIAAFLATIGVGVPVPQSPPPWKIHLGWLAVCLALLATLLRGVGVA